VGTRSAGAIAFVTAADVLAAARRLDGVAHRTPVVSSITLDERVGGHVFVKCEQFQRMGAFKFRGAYNRLSQLSDAERKRGVVAFSSGNHAQGVALAAQLLEMPATIVMPKDAPSSKVEATRGYGAEIVFYDRAEGAQRRLEIAHAIAEERGATLVPPYDDPHIAAGAGTAVLELVEDVNDLDIVVTPCGGGGLLSGSCLAAHSKNPDIAVWGVEPDAGDDVKRSFERGERVSIDLPQTIADGLQTQSPGEVTFAIIEREVAGIATVSDAELIEAMRFAFERMKLVVEPSGAAALAAVMYEKIPVRGKRTGIVISGGNVDRARFASLIA